MDGDSEGQGTSCSRRQLVVTTLAGSLLAQAGPFGHAQAHGDPLAIFIALSRILTGRSDLDAEQAQRLHGALSAESRDFDASARQLLSRMSESQLPVGKLQATLDREASRLAALPRQIVSAWYTGIIGEGVTARCVTFETSLMHMAVRDRLTPPSICHGPHGSWATRPA